MEGFELQKSVKPHVNVKKVVTVGRLPLQLHFYKKVLY